MLVERGALTGCCWMSHNGDPMKRTDSKRRQKSSTLALSRTTCSMATARPRNRLS
ncbi:Uncharacterized protein APZ42_014007 [Daphnia magna]|uniref:Uncharacterized protein n=1 Tax=Daphnia magna TaxID=35525 RepID=A0A162QCY3_9CRUS|nr:Uncharacterized protein APZ42_014007 [Daphnia magna]